ncbi:aryl-alcohol dehydrogenase [Microbacterium foliorum]|uniref:Aryl-alcohol dehydrogenase n=1 Tax=Microbacterium foliorum TaxID=104336 RepID=A0ABU1HVJ9_9MICO|nr:NAD(P)-dependent alcohol dehydrogenase [Microbacterium foliorum]MDR6144082.1 aryl-alcohol dehydrogenase [Microbacterium foliorum]
MPKAIQAAVLDGVGSDFHIQEVELDDPQPHEVVVKVVAAGVCGTDVHVQHGGIPFPLPGVVGHEGAGIVEAVGSAVTTVVPGDKVLLTFSSCGNCRSCLSAHPAYCEEFLSVNLLGGRRADGSTTLRRGAGELSAHFFAQSSFATYALADERGVTKVPDDADLELLAPLGCGVQTGAGAVFNVLRPEPGTTLVVYGAGAVGLSAVMAAALSPVAQIIVVDIVPSRLALAAEVGATAVIDSRSEDVEEVIARLTGGRGADAAIDATGVVSVLENASRVVAPSGVVISIGAPAPGATVALDVNHMLNGRRYIGVTEGDSNPRLFLPALVALVQQGRLPVHRLIEAYEFADINAAAEGIRSGATVKPVLRFP